MKTESLKKILNMKLKGKWKTDIKMGITCYDRSHKKKKKLWRKRRLGGGGRAMDRLG